MNLIKNIDKKKKKITSYNLTFSSNKNILYPKNYVDLKNVLKFLEEENLKALIRSGKCGHGDKTILNTSDIVISMEKFNKIISINKKKLVLKAQSGLNLYSLFKILKKMRLSIYNIPGGKTVSLGGAISGNVHGRPQNKKFAVFGDNVISLKVMQKNGKVLNINKKNKLFKKIIGGLSLYGIILEAEIKLFKIKDGKFFKKTSLIKSEKDFDVLNKTYNNFYGYINFLKINKLEGVFFNFEEVKNKELVSLKNEIPISFQDFLHFFKITSLISFFINNFTLKVFYYFLFLFYRLRIHKNISKKISYENSVYFINLNKYLPYYFSGGMIEIQFSIPEKNFFNILKSIKKEFFNFNLFPHFFIIKKLEQSNNGYMFNFPKNKLSVSLCFPKNTYLKKRKFFIVLYKLLLKFNCNFYLTKDETLFDNIKKNNLKNKYKVNETDCLNLISSNFKEKLFKP